MIANNTTMSMPKIGNPYAFLDRNRTRNMVFYGRVSTEHEAQLSALENQIKLSIIPTGMYWISILMRESRELRQKNVRHFFR